VDLPARSFDLACPDAAPPLRILIAHKITTNDSTLTAGLRDAEVSGGDAEVSGGDTAAGEVPGDGLSLRMNSTGALERFGRGLGARGIGGGTIGFRSLAVGCGCMTCATARAGSASGCNRLKSNKTRYIRNREPSSQHQVHKAPPANIYTQLFQFASINQLASQSVGLIYRMLRCMCFWQINDDDDDCVSCLCVCQNN